VVLALGIYSGHYYYKAVNHGLMTYRQGLKLGFIITSFVGLVNALSVYLYTKLIDDSLIVQLTEGVQDTLRKKGMEEPITEKMVLVMQHMSPELLLIGTLVSTVLLGFVFTLVIAAFSRHPRRPHERSCVPS
jgi:predicted GNAT family acetyltransferase